MVNYAVIRKHMNIEGDRAVERRSYTVTVAFDGAERTVTATEACYEKATPRAILRGGVSVKDVATPCSRASLPPATGPSYTRLMTDRVTVQVPATSANLGPGFDSLGVALDWSARFHFAVTPRQERPANVIEQMALTAALAFYTRAALPPPPGIEVRYEGDLPVGRGLGVSAAARVAGVVAANELAEAGHARATLLGIAVHLEGHGDNAAPAMLGGLHIVVAEDDEPVYLRIDPPEELRAVLIVPEFSMPTNESRKALPDRLTRNQAVHNIGRAALLVGALSRAATTC